MSTRRDHILARASDLAGALFYYDRRDDSDLPRGEIEAAIATGEVTFAEILQAFAASAQRNIRGLGEVEITTR